MRSPDDLLAAAQSGDARALSELVAKHRHGVSRYGLQVCRTTEDAEDAVQETLWAATRAIKAFLGSASSIVSWMFTTPTSFERAHANAWSLSGTAGRTFGSTFMRSPSAPSSRCDQAFGGVNG